MTLFNISSVSIERFKTQRFAWIYLCPEKKPSTFDTATELAVALKSIDGCGAVVSTGDGLDLDYNVNGTLFRLAFDGIHGLVIECNADDEARVKQILSPFLGHNNAVDGQSGFGEA